MTRRVRWMEAWRQNLRANGWFPVSWVGVLGLQLRNDPNLHLAMELSLVGMVAVAATVPKLPRRYASAPKYTMLPKKKASVIIRITFLCLIKKTT